MYILIIRKLIIENIATIKIGEKIQQIVNLNSNLYLRVLEIESVNVIASDLNKMINQFNIRIEQNNELVKNQKKKQKKRFFKNQLWNFLVYNSREHLELL